MLGGDGSECPACLGLSRAASVEAAASPERQAAGHVLQFEGGEGLQQRQQWWHGLQGSTGQVMPGS